MLHRHPLDSPFAHVLVVVAALSGLMALGLLHPTEIGTSLVGVGLGALWVRGRRPRPVRG